MLVRTPADLAVIRDRRKQLKLDQAALAKRIGVSRQWAIEMERGCARAELALVLRALDALSIRLTPPRSTRLGPIFAALSMLTSSFGKRRSHDRRIDGSSRRE
jgi:DNA-binding XRE family transcriptional regulator